jgi:hypothetical protein
MVPASTGMTAISKYAVMSQVQQNIGIFIKVMPGGAYVENRDDDVDGAHD